LEDAAQSALRVGGDEAHHAVRVLRVAVGDGVRLCDGRGTVVAAAIERISKDRSTGDWELYLAVGERRLVPRSVPAVHVFASSPKGDRLADMVDVLSQVGAASFAPMLTQRTVVDPRDAKLERLHRVAVEGLKQCGRAWLLELAPPPVAQFADAIAMCAAAGRRLVVADAMGQAYRASGAAEIALFVGPEGGLTAGELETLRGAGAMVAKFGPHMMRIETAAGVAAATIMQVEGA